MNTPRFWLALLAVLLLCPAAAKPPHQSITDQQLQTADSYRQRNLLDNAQRIYENVLQSEPGSFRANYGLGLALLGQGKTDDAITYLSKAEQSVAKEEKPDYTIYNALGWALVRTGHLHKAEPMLQAGMTHLQQLDRPAQISLLNNMASVYMASGRAEEAKPLLKQAADLGSQRARSNQRAIMAASQRGAH
jgi:Tfp pilus assembly protein PilF